MGANMNGKKRILKMVFAVLGMAIVVVLVFVSFVYFFVFPFAAQRTKSFFGGDTNLHMNEKEGMPTTFFMTGDTDSRAFPEDYEVMVFDKVPPQSERPPGFYWNHGSSHGVVISTRRNEIVYWAESW